MNGRILQLKELTGGRLGGEHGLDSHVHPDVYVVVRCGGDEFRTPTVAKSSSPEWHGVGFQFVGALRQLLFEPVFFECFDEDLLGFDQSVGVAELSATELKAMVDEACEREGAAAPVSLKRLGKRFVLPLSTQGGIVVYVAVDSVEPCQSLSLASILWDTFGYPFIMKCRAWILYTR